MGRGESGGYEHQRRGQVAGSAAGVLQGALEAVVVPLLSRKEVRTEFRNNGVVVVGNIRGYSREQQVGLQTHATGERTSKILLLLLYTIPGIIYGAIAGWVYCYVVLLNACSDFD